MKQIAGFLMASAAMACFGTAESAHAQFAFGAGSTFPAIAYRQLMDCLYNQVQGTGTPGRPGPYPISPACPSYPSGNSSGLSGEIIYAPTGSADGKAVLIANNNNMIDMPSGKNLVPWTDRTLGINAVADYDGVQFIGSEDVINPQDVANWNAAGNPAKFGNLIQFPALIGAVGIGFNGKDGNGLSLNILPPIPVGGSSGLNLSRNAMCGIFSGHITRWNNPILTALNGGVLGTGNITVVHRLEGSGTNFLLSNALVAQCRTEFGPNNEADATLVSYAFPWTDRAATSCPFLPVHGANQLNWPDSFGGIDQCGNAIPNPGGGHFMRAFDTYTVFFSGGTISLVSYGSSGVQDLVATTNGAIGYASPSYWAPQGGINPITLDYRFPRAANLQSLWDLSANTGAFQPPTALGAQIAMSAATPVFNATTRPNPLAWSLQGTVTDPAAPGAYPISGFSWLDMYQCYQPHSNGNNPFVWLRLFLDYLYASNDAHNILNDDGFAPVPGPWLTEIYTLLNDPINGPNITGSGGCAGKVGAY
jgi:ABC-type phosphate transport system substrate-binding protein